MAPVGLEDRILTIVFAAVALVRYLSAATVASIKKIRTPESLYDPLIEINGQRHQAPARTETQVFLTVIGIMPGHQLGTIREIYVNPFRPTRSERFARGQPLRRRNEAKAPACVGDRVASLEKT